MDSSSYEEYLKPTELCDFDQAPEIRYTAIALTSGLTDTRYKVVTIATFVKELKYVYEDWTVRASQTLVTQKGMCSSKTNLFIALLRCVDIPARYRVFRVKAELDLFEWLITQDMRIEWANYIELQDHVVADVLLDDWHAYDLSKDTAYENGLKKLGIPLELHPVRGGLLTLASFDEWAFRRQQKRKPKENEPGVFSLANEQLERIRLLGKP